MNPLLAQFIPEARDLLDRASSGVLALEREPDAHDVINDVFRAVHTLKGTSGLFDIAPLMRLAHAAEDLLDEVRGGELDLNSEMVDNLLTSLDLIGQWINELEGARAPSRRRRGEGGRARAGRCAPGWRRSSRPRALRRRKGHTARRRSGFLEFSEAERLTAFKAARGAKLTAWTFDPEEDCFFRGDDPIGAVRHSPALLAVRARPNRAIGTLDSLDPLQCWLSFQAISGASRGAIEEHMRYVADRIEVVEIEAADLILPIGAHARGPVFRDFAELARRQLAAGDLAPAFALDRNAVEHGGADEPAGLGAAMVRRLSRGLPASSRPQEIERLIVAIETGATPARTPLAPPAALEPAAPPSEWRETTRGGWRSNSSRRCRVPCAPEIAAGRLQSVASILRAEFAALGRSSAPLEPALATAMRDGDLEPLKALLPTLFGPEAEPKAPARPEPKDAPPLTASAPARVAPEPGGEGAGLPRVLRVDQGKIDAIMNLVAELIVAKNSLNYLADLAENKHGSRAMAREIKDAYAVIRSHNAGTSTRRHVGSHDAGQPDAAALSTPCARPFARAGQEGRARDRGRRHRGRQERARKPCRSAHSHRPQQSRPRARKPRPNASPRASPRHGVVRISARHESDFVVIEVSDDGRGVDIARVRAKAVKVGVITAERAEQMSEQETANLIFLPGFSTKDEVSDLSGRGVGMDVVRSTVVKAGGEVALRTRAGQGSTVVIRLPLTMAVTRIVTVDCNGRLFGIPMDLIAETVRVPQAPSGASRTPRPSSCATRSFRSRGSPNGSASTRAREGRRRSRHGRAGRGRARRRRRRRLPRTSRGGRQAAVGHSRRPDWASRARRCSAMAKCC